MLDTIPLTDDELRRQIIGLPTMKVNTAATLPGVGTGAPPVGGPVAPKPAYEQPSTAPVGVPPSMLPMPKVMSPIEGQINQNISDRQRMIDSGPGVSQIKNPFLRTIARIGDVAEGIALPQYAALTPGTTLHHQVLLRQNANELGKLEGAQHEEAQTAAEKAQVPNIEAETELHKAQAEAAKNPKQEKPEGLSQEYADAVKAQIDAIPNVTPQQKTQMLADAITQIQRQPAPAAPKGEKEFADEYHAQHPNATVAETQRAYKLNQELPQRPPQVMVMVPSANGGYTPTAIHPGQEVPAGAVTPSGMSSLNVPTSATRTMAETAPKVIDLADRAAQLIDQQIKTLGPAASRWNEFMAGTVGAPNPEFTKLRTDIGLLQTALMRMHVGARGGEQIMEHFRNLIDVSKQSPENLKAALGEIRDYAREVGASGKSSAGGATSSGTTHFTEGADHWDIPADKLDAFKKAHPNAKAQ